MMIEMITASPFLMGAATIVVMLTCVWVASLVLRDAGIIDMFWGLGYALIALTTLLSSENLSPLAIATGIAIIAWGVRLFTHLLLRWRKEPEEDYRYQNMRKKHGDQFWWRSIYTVFLFQGL